MPQRKAISNPDIQFRDPNLIRLMQHVRALTKEVQRFQQMLGQGEADQVLTKTTGADYDATWQPGGGSGSGDITGAVNIGSGAEIFATELSGVLNFRTLIEGDNIVITVDDDEVRIDSTATISVNWDDITGKPSTFPPSAHTHPATAISYNNATSGLSATNVQAALDEIVAGGGGGYTDENAQDAVGTILDDTATINFTYNDGAPSITADVNEAALVIDWSQLDNIPVLVEDLASLGDPGADRILFWDDSAGVLEYLTVGTGLLITGTTLSATGGGGSSPLTTKGDLYTYSTVDARLPVGANTYMLTPRSTETTGLIWIPGPNVTPDTHPETPHSLSDEFEEGSLNARWTWRNQGTATATFADGSLILTALAASGDDFKIIEQTHQSGNWKVNAKMTFRGEPSDFPQGGIILYRSTGPRSLVFGPTYESGYKRKVARFNGTTGFSANVYGPTDDSVRYGPINRWGYFELERNGTNYIYRLSATGVAGTYVTVLTEAQGSHLGAAADTFGLYVSSSNGSNNCYLIVDYFRFTALP